MAYSTGCPRCLALARWAQFPPPVLSLVNAGSISFPPPTPPPPTIFLRFSCEALAVLCSVIGISSPSLLGSSLIALVLVAGSTAESLTRSDALNFFAWNKHPQHAARPTGVFFHHCFHSFLPGLGVLFPSHPATDRRRLATTRDRKDSTKSRYYYFS